MRAIKEESKLLSSGSSAHNYGDPCSLSGDLKPVTLTWENISVFVSTGQSQGCSFRRSKTATVKDEEEGVEKCILNDVSGIVKPGTLLAIMGASGAGKTTLMNVLTGRSGHRLRIEGKVRVNGQDLGDQIKYMSAYVQQDDLFVPSLTVSEHLWFQAVLRLSSNLSDTVRRRRVQDAMAELSMTDLADTRIGKPGTNAALSGGERKRLTFATEVLTNSGLMFCDEPTSGLDSFMAQSIVESLRKLASRGRTILCTIHQPSSEVYGLMDRVCLMADGRTSYIGSTENILKFFTSMGYVCPSSFNPADHFIHTLAVIPGQEPECRKRIKAICDTYARSSHYEAIKADISRHSDRDTFLAEMETLSDSYSEGQLAQLTEEDRKLEYKASWWTQFRMLLWRCWLNNVRTPGLIRTRILQTVIQAIVVAYLYFQTPYNQSGVLDIDGALFLVQIQITFGNVFGVCSTLPQEYNLFLREYHNGAYRVIAYYVTHLLVELFIYVINPTLFILILYWTIGLVNTAASVFTAIGATIMLSLNAMAFGHLLGTMTCDAAIAVALVPLFITPLMYAGGFFINLGTVPWYVKPVQWLSWFAYTNEILTVNQWKDIGYIDCETRKAIYAEVNYTSIIVGYDESMCYHDGPDIINNLSFSVDNVGFDFGALAILFTAFEVTAYLLLLLHSKRKQ